MTSQPKTWTRPRAGLQTISEPWTLNFDHKTKDEPARVTNLCSDCKRLLSFSPSGKLSPTRSLPESDNAPPLAYLAPSSLYLPISHPQPKFPSSISLLSSVHRTFARKENPHPSRSFPLTSTRISLPAQSLFPFLHPRQQGCCSLPSSVLLTTESCNIRRGPRLP